MVNALLIDIVEILNSGREITATEFASNNGVSRRTVVDYIKSIQRYFLKESLRNSRGVWKVKKGGFLRHLGMTAEELVILVGLMRAAENEGGQIGQTYETIARGHSERAWLGGEETSGQEPLSVAMRISAQLINSAIDRGVKIVFLFERHYRIVQPFQLFVREHYWYLAGFEESKTHKDDPTTITSTLTIKTYSLYRIKAVRVLEELITHNFSNAHAILQYALNGYVSWDDEPQEVHLLITEGLANTLSRAGAYRHWTYIHKSSEREGYVIYKAYSVHRDFNDIIPMIMKHTPDIIVLHPIELMHKIRERMLRQLEDVESRIGCKNVVTINSEPSL